ncbi:MAG: hypothetical protein OXG60_07295 [Chloroflexi bacterium]|nr:hypothetical protein [Chloroflexota bacterium]
MQFTDKAVRQMVRQLVKGYHEYKWPEAIFYLQYENREWLLTPNEHPDHVSNPLEEMFREYLGNGRDTSDSSFHDLLQVCRHKLLDHGYISFVDDKVSRYSSQRKGKGKLNTDGRFEFELPRPTYYGASLSLTAKAFDIPSERQILFNKLTKIAAALAAFVVSLNQLRELFSNIDIQVLLDSVRSILPS